MKKILLSSALFVMLSIGAKAQFSVGLGGNYTKYGGELDKATPGVQLRLGYNFTEKKGASLGFTYGLPMKDSYSDEDGGKIEQKTQLMTVSLSGVLHLIGGYEDPFSLYFPIGGSYVFGKTEISGGGFDDEEKLSGPVINGGVGIQFQIGSPFIFAEAGFALPANQTTNSRGQTTSTFENAIPGHTVLTLGIKFPLGSSGY